MGHLRRSERVSFYECSNLKCDRIDRIGGIGDDGLYYCWAHVEAEGGVKQWWSLSHPTTPISSKGV